MILFKHIVRMKVIEELCKLHSSDAMFHSWYVLAKYLAVSVGTVP